jgi:hypothetical protein
MGALALPLQLVGWLGFRYRSNRALIPDMNIWGFVLFIIHEIHIDNDSIEH